MEDSKAQKKIIDLGKSIVIELELDPGVDTLSKWMAHYLAEKIELTEKLNGNKKSQAENECFKIILKLWENRWSAPPVRNYLEDFKPLLETLEKLNPNKKTPFFYPSQIQSDLEEEKEDTDSDNMKSHLDAALKIDKLARSLIFDSLNQAVSGLELNGDRGKYIRNSIDLVDYPDTKIIRFTSDYNKFLKSQEDERDDEKSERIEELKKRINDLEEFNSLKDSLLVRYKKKLSELEK